MADCSKNLSDVSGKIEDVTPEGQKFIKSFGEDLIKGTATISRAFTNSITVKFDGTSDPKFPYTLEEYQNNLIKWFNKYGEEFSMNSNILAAQVFQESSFRTWEASPTGALGLTQFIPDSIFRFVSGSDETKLKKGISGDVGSRSNREQLHKNVARNPEIMIKAQAEFLDYMASRWAGNRIASVLLFGYNRGEGYIQKPCKADFITSVNTAIRKAGHDYAKEGVYYVDSIINSHLPNHFGFSVNKESLGSVDKIFTKATKQAFTPED